MFEKRKKVLTYIKLLSTIQSLNTKLFLRNQGFIVEKKEKEKKDPRGIEKKGRKETTFRRIKEKNIRLYIYIYIYARNKIRIFFVSLCKLVSKEDTIMLKSFLVRGW